MKILLLGKGISNLGVAKLLDEKNILYEIKNTDEVTNYDYDIVIKSPGIQDNNEVVLKFRKKKIKIVSDIEFVYNLVKPKVIGITGSNGKTTTVNYIYEMIKTSFQSFMCGNIGYSFAEASMQKNDLLVCELSSFELNDTINFSPFISVMLNIKPCHLDYHLKFQNYIDAKKKITTNQTEDDYLIYNYDDDNLRQIAKDSIAKKISFSTKSSLANCYLFENSIYIDGKKILNIKHIKLLGEHNIQNVMAACCVAKILDVKKSLIKKGVKNFNGVNYRITEVEKDIFNDAKSTNPYSTIEAIKTLNSKVDLICGGYDRNENIDALIPLLTSINRVYAYGQTKDKLFDFFTKNNIQVFIFDNLIDATTKAYDQKEKNVKLLYSPMFASYDQYENYIQRGKEFSELIKKSKSSQF